MVSGTPDTALKKSSLSEAKEPHEFLTEGRGSFCCRLDRGSFPRFFYGRFFSRLFGSPWSALFGSGGGRQDRPRFLIGNACGTGVVRSAA